MEKNRLPNQIVGNAGLYYICYELSKRGWNVLPTSRNTRGVDLVIYNQSAKLTHTVQIKALSYRNPVPFGNNLGNLLAEYIVICVLKEKPEIFIAKTDEVRHRIHQGIKDGKKSYWLQPKDYDNDVFRDKWDKIGKGYK